jgi:hypothetical protein
MSSSDQRRNVFGIFAELGKVPFAVSRWNWKDTDYAVVTKVIPKGDYGVAYGFPVHDGVPNDHFAYERRWREDMTMPNAGSYQWRVIDVPELQLQQLIRTFQSTVAPQFEFGRAPDEVEEEFL